MRVVLDVGVLVSARLSGRGSPAMLVRRWLAGEFEIIVSPQLLDELDDVLHRPKFGKWLTAVEADVFVAFLREHAVVVDDPPAEHGLTRDPDDDYLVTLARAARADVLVSVDRDLLDIDDPRPPTCNPGQLIEWLDSLDNP